MSTLRPVPPPRPEPFWMHGRIPFIPAALIAVGLSIYLGALIAFVSWSIMHARP